MFSFGWKSKKVQSTPGNRGRLHLKRSKLAIERLERFDFFVGADYRELHHDIGSMNAATHFVGYGANEGRLAANMVHLARTLGSFKDRMLPRAVAEDAGSAGLKLTVGVYVSSLSNAFTHEIAAALVMLLRTAGHEVVEGDENADVDARPSHCIYVAPHEFFFLGRGPIWVRDEVLSTACMYCTEQVQTTWFWKSLPLVLMARSVVDMSAPLASAFAAVMPAACVLPSIGRARQPILPEALSHPILRGQEWWNGAGGRPLDFCFLATTSPYRAKFLAKYAGRLSRYESFTYLRTKNANEAMNIGNDESELVGVAKHIARHSRILLNVHRDEFPYFEWHRLVYNGMANGCTVVTEPCCANLDFEPGVHYLAEETHRLVDLMEWLLNDPDGKERAATVAAASLTAACDTQRERARANALVTMLTTEDSSAAQ